MKEGFPRLFRVNERRVSSEALAGTRVRGQTPSEDKELLRELLSSKKDMLENEITGQFIKQALNELVDNGWLEKNNKDKVAINQADDESAHQQRYFVRRLRHLQHICQTFEGKLSEKANVIDVSQSLLRGLHPTPAVCGDSPVTALEFIRKYETRGFDRGFYAGPVGYIGKDSADVVVAIRSALVTNYCGIGSKSAGALQPLGPSNSASSVLASKVSVFGEAGVVNGSTPQGEWSETSQKMGVISSLFPPSPIKLHLGNDVNAVSETSAKSKSLILTPLVEEPHKVPSVISSFAKDEAVEEDGNLMNVPSIDPLHQVILQHSLVPNGSALTSDREVSSNR